MLDELDVECLTRKVGHFGKRDAFLKIGSKALSAFLFLNGLRGRAPRALKIAGLKIPSAALLTGHGNPHSMSNSFFKIRLIS